MNSQSPRVSIGLPVYNGENYLRVALDAVLAQTYQDWELIISDNCSTDATESICRAYAAKDDRIRYSRNVQNLGGVPNLNRVLALARGEYFKFYAHDDAILPTYVERTVEALDRNPEAVLAHSKTMIIDDAGDEIGPDPFHLRASSPDPRQRFHDMVWRPHHCFQIYGLMRTVQVPMMGMHSSADQRLLAEMCLLGPFCEIDEFLFLCRRHSQQSTALLPSYMRGRRRNFFGRVWQIPHTSWADPSKDRKLSFPMWRIVKEYTYTVGRAPVGLSVKLWCWASLAVFFIANWHRLGRDVVVAIDQLIQQTDWMERRAISAGEAVPGPAEESHTRERSA